MERYFATIAFDAKSQADAERVAQMLADMIADGNPPTVVKVESCEPLAPEGPAV